MPLKYRLIWWFGIYLGFQLPLIMLWPFFFNYPWGLDPYLAFSVGSDHEPAFRTFGYYVYLSHLALTVALPGKRAFRLLMVVLIILVTLNTVSCMKTTWPMCLKGMPNIQG